MENATILLSLFAGVMLTSCAGVSPTRIIGDTVGAAGGALIGNKLSNGNPLITAASAGGGVLLSESLQAGSKASAYTSLPFSVNSRHFSFIPFFNASSSATTSGGRSHSSL